jgi:hypothetical protein
MRRLAVPPSGRLLLGGRPPITGVREVPRSGVAIVKPHLHDVLKMLDGTPPADLMHFALHGNFDPGRSGTAPDN